MLLFVVSACAGLFSFFHPTFLSGFAFIQTDPGDTRLNNYILEHSYQWVTGNPLHSKFWTLPVYFPAVNTAAYSDILLSPAPIYWLFRLVGFLPDTAFQLWMCAMALLDFLFAMLLFKKGMGLSAPAAIGGSYVFAFSGIRANQLNIPQLLPQFFSIFAIFCLFKIFEKNGSHERKKIWIVLFPLSVVLQLYAGFYLAFFLCFGLLVTLIVALAFRDSRAAILAVVKSHRRTIVLSLGLAAFISAWPILHYLASQHEVGTRKWEEISSMIPRAKSWLNTGPENLVYKWSRDYIDFSKLPTEPEQRICPGPVTFVIALLGFVGALRFSWARVVLISCGTIAALAFLYPGDWSPWTGVLWLIPGAGAIRAVARISFLLLIGLSMGTALFLNGIRRQYVLILLVVVMGLEQVQTTPSYNKEEIRSEVAQIAKHIPANCKSFYFAIGLSPDKKPRPWFEYQIDGMWAEIASGIPTVNGFSGNMPPDWWPLWDPVIKTGADLTRLHLSIFKWADLNGLSKDDICMVPVLYGADAALEPEFGPVDLKMGQGDSRVYLGEGWGEDEWDRDVSWVWAVGQFATLYVPMKKDADYVMGISCAPIPIPGRKQEMIVRINGTELTRLRLEKGANTYRIPIPAAMVKNYDKVQFLFAYAVSPAMLGEAPDTRRLAVSFDRITFTPSEQGQK